MKARIAGWLLKRMSYEQKLRLVKKVAPEFFESLSPDQRVDLLKESIPILMNALDAETIADLLVAFPQIKSEITHEIGKNFLKNVLGFFRKD